MINSVSFMGISNVKINNSLKNKTEKYYKEMFSALERHFSLGKRKEEFYNPRTHKITTIYPISSSQLVSVRPLNGNDELILTKIPATNGLTRTKGNLNSNNFKYSNSTDNYSCEIWDPVKGFINVKNL